MSSAPPFLERAIAWRVLNFSFQGLKNLAESEPKVVGKLEKLPGRSAFCFYASLGSPRPFYRFLIAVHLYIICAYCLAKEKEIV